MLSSYLSSSQQPGVMVVYPILGGILIGAAVSLMLLFNGRVAGISGIVGGLLWPGPGQFFWRLAFVLGLLSGGFAVLFYRPQSFAQTAPAPIPLYAAAGLLVGFGSLLGNGCTSGHGVCGISRMSARSWVATMIFIAFGAFGVWLSRFLGVSV